MEVPMIVGIGALRTRDVLKLAQDAQKVGVPGMLLAPMPYRKLSDDVERLSAVLDELELA